MIKCIDDTNEALLYMDAEEAVKWIDEKIIEGEKIKKENDEELNQGIELLHKEWRRIRIKRLWEIAQRK